MTNTDNGNEYYYVTNIQGDIISLIDGSGTSVVQYSYDAWGNQTSCTGTLANTLGQANPYRYRGYRFDTETGLYYLQSRYYDAVVGRFINADVTDGLAYSFGYIQRANLFAYCSNDPVNTIDANGYFGTPIQWACAIIGGIIGVPFGDYLARKLGYSSGWKYWAIRVAAIIGGAALGWFAGTAIISAVKLYISANAIFVLQLPKWVIDLLGLYYLYNQVVIGETMSRVIDQAERIGAGVYSGLYNYDSTATTL